MNSPDPVFERYQVAIQAYFRLCATDPQGWHRPDGTEFSELRRLLLAPAGSGDMLCQYALATILWFGLCCESEEQFQTGYAAAIEEATRWWLAAAKQDYWPALDNLVTSGVGAEA